MLTAAECRKKIADLNAHAMGDSTEWDAHGREVFALVQRMADEIERLSVPAECTDEMAHAMSRLDGFDRDRDMPGLQRWKDYWAAAIEAARMPPSYDNAPTDPHHGGKIWEDDGDIGAGLMARDPDMSDYEPKRS